MKHILNILAIPSVIIFAFYTVLYIVNRKEAKKIEREYRKKHPKTKRSNSSAWPLSLWNDDNLPD
jgi:hypothetical protein